MASKSPLQNEKEFSAFFSECYGPLVLFAMRFTGNQVTAEDVVTESFINIWNKRETLFEVFSLKSYLYTIIRNACIQYNRKQKREIICHEMLGSIQTAYDRNALENIVYAETMGKIYAAIDRLPNQCKKVFLMHFIDGKKFSEIAQELGISVGTVKTHKVRGINHLQKTLQLLMCLAGM